MISISDITGHFPTLTSIEINALPDPYPPIGTPAIHPFINVSWDSTRCAEIIAILSEKLFCNVQYAKEYYYEDMVYSYDLTNDTQKTYQRDLLNYTFDCIGNNRTHPVFVTAIHDENLKNHSFPSTNRIHAIRIITSRWYKICNRIHIVVSKAVWEGTVDEEWSIYINYRHSPNVEVTKMDDALARSITILRGALSKR